MPSSKEPANNACKWTVRYVLFKGFFSLENIVSFCGSILVATRRLKPVVVPAAFLAISFFVQGKIMDILQLIQEKIRFLPQDDDASELKQLFLIFKLLRNINSWQKRRR